jgi:hypothetical protein
VFDGGFLHLTALTVDLKDCKIARLSATGIFIAILLIAASVTQSVHTCAFAGFSTRHELSARTTDLPCKACLLGPAVASATLPLFAVALLEVPMMVPVGSPVTVVTVRHGFVISVRPPPLASLIPVA